MQGTRMVLLIKCINSFYVLIIRKSIIYIFYFRLKYFKVLTYLFHIPLIGITKYIFTIVIQIVCNRGT